MKKLRIAIIGQGRSGRDIHGAFLKSEANTLFDVVAVVEFDPARRELALKEYPGCEVYEDYHELYSRDDIDLVVNASYSEMHYPVSKDLLENGFNVLVEKPFARNRYECDTLINLAKEKGLTLAVFQQSFLAPYYLYAYDLIKSGKLGDIYEIRLCYNGFNRRWDWQTLQCKMAGVTYNTGPHPIGLALGFLDFDENYKVVYSKLAKTVSSGDAEDFSKIIMTAPGKPVIDIEMQSLDAYPQDLLKICGTKGTFLSTTTKYKMKYVVDGENPERPVIFESLKNDKGLPAYCSEKRVTHEEEGEFEGTAFNSAVSSFYTDLYYKITENRPLRVTPEMAREVISVVEKAHADNPMPVKYVL